MLAVLAGSGPPPFFAEAQAQAEANRLLAESVTPTLVQYEMAKKWNGQMPQVSGGATPLIQMPSVPR